MMRTKHTGSVECVIYEVLRVLKPSGFFLHVSLRPPKSVLPYLALTGSAPWTVEVVSLRKAPVPFLDDAANGDGAEGVLKNYLLTVTVIIESINGRLFLVNTMI